MKALKTNQHGFTLIEVLVALVILSVGLLGIAGMQVAGIRNTHYSYLRSQATAFAGEITDRMRANCSGAQAGFYNFTAASTIPTSPANNAGDLSNQNLANGDLADWLTRLRNTLPQGTATIACTTTDTSQACRVPPSCNVTITWQEGETTGSGGTTTPLTSRTILATRL
jgi:type IV pilus assembly protein PilV